MTQDQSTRRPRNDDAPGYVQAPQDTIDLHHSVLGRRIISAFEAGEIKGAFDQLL